MNNNEFFKNLTGIRGIDKEITVSNRMTQEVELSAEEEEVQKIIDDTVQAYVDKNGDEETIYANYDDQLSESQIAQIMSSTAPNDTFMEIMDDAYQDSDWEVLKDIAYNKLELEKEFVDEHFNEIMDTLFEKVHVSPDYNHFLDTGVQVDVFRKESDTVSNEILVFEENGDLVGIAEPIGWLLAKQGYSVEEFCKYYNKLQQDNADKDEAEEFDYGTNKFLGSLVEELDNYTGTGFLDVVFLGTINLSDIVKDEYTSVHIPKQCTCGLVDTRTGSGGLLGIKLEKDINLSRKEADILFYEGYHYNVDEIFGITYDSWRNVIDLD